MNVCFAPCPVIFDLDGTLIDSAPDIHACVNAVPSSMSGSENTSQKTVLSGESEAAVREARVCRASGLGMMPPASRV